MKLFFAEVMVANEVIHYSSAESVASILRSEG